ncbi:MAG: cell division protein FtsB [Alpinimonas sp.]|jgi:cell division protein FtsB
MVKNRRLTKVPVAMAVGTNKAGVWLGSIRLSGFTMLIMGLTLLGVLILAPQLQILIEQRQQIADLRSVGASTQAELDDLTSQRARWDDPAYVRAQARDRLYYVMPGEISYLVINDVTLDPNKRVLETTELKNTNNDWVAGLLGSFLVAGLGTQTPAELAPSIPAATGG